MSVWEIFTYASMLACYVDPSVAEITALAILTVSSHCIVLTIDTYSSGFLFSAKLKQLRIESALIRMIITITGLFVHIDIKKLLLMHENKTKGNY